MQLGLPFQPDSSDVQFYFVRHKRARRYVLRVDHDGRARVTIPRGGSERAGAAFGRRHLDWISDQRARLPQSTLGIDERRTLRQQAAVELPAQLMELAARHGLRPSGVRVRDQRTRWGSYGPDGHISLNWRLLLMPAWVREYVIVHELMHLRRHDHSRRYWRLVAEVCPEYEAARRWLREHGPSLR